MKTYRILVAPLDWGLGHATRCIPVIQLLLKKGYEVHIASSGDALRLLQLEFPQLKQFILPSYKVSYSQRLPFMIKVFLQLPKFLWVINKENKTIEEITNQSKYDLIISDNRYGCRASNVKSVFICHQLNIIMPRLIAWVAPVINYVNHVWIGRFDQCWIPDDLSSDLTGRLSTPALHNSEWVGVLSRFKKGESVATEFQLAVLLSGPEPQRSVFEKKILHQLSGLNIKSILVRGRLDVNPVEKDNRHLMVINYLHGEELQSIIEKSEVVLCRSGYSTIMDLVKLQKKAVFVPTPGQTEQEYLGFRLMDKGVALCQRQNDFDLEQALEEIKNYSGFVGSLSETNLLNKAIEKALK